MKKNAPILAASSHAIVADLRPASPLIVLMTPVYTGLPVAGEDLPAHDHRIAVLFDEDEDERVVDVLTAILYGAPSVYKKIAAVAEHKGLLTVWARGTSSADRTFISAAANPVVLRGDSWSVVVREMHLDEGVYTLKVREYSAPSLSLLPQRENPNKDDRLIKALHEVVPLGVDPVDGSVTRLSELAQLEHDIEKVLAPVRATTKSTLTLKRSRGSRE